MESPDSTTGEPGSARQYPMVPFWVHAAVSLVSSRRGGTWLVLSCIPCILYCLPWPDLLEVRDRFSPWYLAPDWSWTGAMLLLTGWYAAAVAWMNRHDAWPQQRL